MMELADIRDLKSRALQACGFEPRCRHQLRKSPEAMKKALGLFSYAGRAFSSLPAAIRCAGFAAGLPPCGRYFFETKLSILTVPSTSEEAQYRLLRLFSKVRARSRRCSSVPTATRCVGFAVGGPPCGRLFLESSGISILNHFSKPI